MSIRGSLLSHEHDGLTVKPNVLLVASRRIFGEDPTDL
jgi:hypothetical protein